MGAFWQRRTFGGGGSGGSGGGRRGLSRVGSGGGGEPVGRPQGLWELYLSALSSSPLLVKAVTSAILNALGDLIAQVVVEKHDPQPERLLKYAALGALLVAPALHFWYGLLGRMVPFGGNKGAIVRMVLDQLVFAPIFTSTFFVALFTIEGKRHEIRPKLEADLFTVIKMNWSIWVPAQFLNFRFVPPHLQVLASNFTSLLWNSYLSYASHNAVS